ncbi:hypothetical protein Q9Q94_03495 [Uliginosibacterium sp. 31-16]|uniref:hypothetical protein n=1 Tax=Uliginosibacterium sp. 31-16 TaxID=3068315 RepID=UPI00273E16B4|nr:hypothetical protein [Uliginosibacterium sp. 31-16]MDP5238576.1 hypothetical protein [Uliginosibacterium sp. 31-16]
MSRNRTLLLGATAVVLMALAVLAAQIGTARLSEARARATAAGKQMAAAQSLELRADAQAQLAQIQQRVVSEASGMGLEPSRWVERKLALRQVVLSRDKGDRLIRDTARRPGQLFDVEEFEVSVLGADEGLFDAPAETTRGLQLSLQGTVLNREALGTP